MKTLLNIPFEDAPRELVTQFKPSYFTYDDYLNACPLFNDLPTYWNVAVFDDDDQIVAFSWGTYEPLDQLMHVVRISILRSRKTDYNIKICIYAGLNDIRRMLHARQMFFVTNRPEVFLGRDDGAFKLHESTLLEVTDNESLHPRYH